MRRLLGSRAAAGPPGRGGDYNGLSGFAGTFFPSWTDRRNGGKEEIWTAPLVDQGPPE